MPKPDTVIEAGDEVLLVLDPGLEEAITAFFAPNGHAGRVLSAPRRRPRAALVLQAQCPPEAVARLAILYAETLSGIVQLAVTPGSGPGDWGSSPCPGVPIAPRVCGAFRVLWASLVPGFHAGREKRSMAEG